MIVRFCWCVLQAEDGIRDYDVTGVQTCALPIWTAVSWRALWDTYGFGVGLGGTRASNAFVAVASNTGVLGAALFYGFLAWLFLRPLPDSPDLARGAMAAARWAFLPGFTVGLMVGTSANFGALAALYFAILAVAAPSASRVERELRPRRLIRNPGRAIAFSRRP